MDYVDAFQNLRTNNKYGRRSPHKAVMMLTVIELYEKNELSENEIVYDDSLKTMFLQVWNRVLPDEPLFHPEAYLPFWYLQSDSFWHIVPQRGKEDILSLMRDTNIKPSEAKLYDCVRYAELDEDLYFLMTLPSGRSSLKRVLLETYTNLKAEQIDKLAESSYNAIDYSIEAISEYEKIVSKENSNNDVVPVETDDELVRHFQRLNEDIQFVLNIQYYSFLKSHRNEREMFKEVFPSVYDLLDKILNHPIQKGDIAPSFAFTYDNFLSDLRIALMSEDGAMELINKISEDIDLLRGSDINVVIDEPIEETLDIEQQVSDFEETSYGDAEDTLSQEYIIENRLDRCYIINNLGATVFSSDGKLKRLNNVFYKVKYSKVSLSIYLIQKDGKGLFVIKRRILSARTHSPLLERLDEQNYLGQIRDVKYDSQHDEYYVQIGRRWYGSSGYYADLDGLKTINSLNDAFQDKTQNQKESLSVEDREPNKAPVDEYDNEYSDLEIEHVYLDSRGKVVEKKISKEILPEINTNTENRKGKPWTKEEEELITRYFQQGIDTAALAENFGRTEVAIKSRLAKLGLIEYTYGEEESETVKEEGVKKNNESDFTIENIFNRCAIRNKMGERVFSSEGKLKYINGRLYRLNQKIECFTLKSMQFNGDEWVMGGKKIVAYPQTALYGIMEHAIDHLNEVEDIEDNPVFENCKLKVKGIWYKYNGKLTTDDSDDLKEKSKREKDRLSLLKSPLYAVRKQAILRAMGFFRLPAKIRDITRTISRTAWGSNINEDDVEDMIKTISDIESVDGGYILRKKR